MVRGRGGGCFSIDRYNCIIYNIYDRVRCVICSLSDGD